MNRLVRCLTLFSSMLSGDMLSGDTVDTPVKNYKEYRNLMAQYEREFKNTIYMI